MEEPTNAALHALSPLDGRYLKHTAPLRAYFSEAALIRYRVKVELLYLLRLGQLGLKGFRKFTAEEEQVLARLAESITDAHVARVKAIEKSTNHDVKAVEYFLREELAERGMGDVLEFIHFGLTSQDINNTAIPASLRDGLQQVMFPKIEELIERLKDLANQWKPLSMLTHTHGQPASPTKLGKEINVFVERVEKQLAALKELKHYGKFGGATGNFNAHRAAYPNNNWPAFADNFLRMDLGLVRNATTTQIDHYDDLAAIFDNLRRTNVVLVDLCRDIWAYISMDYLKQKTVANEVGSSAMPHKVNPIDFENAEGNLLMANAVFDFLSNKLPVSRLQRDLTDSTVLRNLGLPLGHTLIALSSILRGLDKIEANEEALANDLEQNQAVLAEAIQTVLRREGVEHPYELLKQLTRGNRRVTRKTLAEFISTLPVDEEVKQELLALTPANYTGIA